jgi:hypothetical protein
VFDSTFRFLPRFVADNSFKFISLRPDPTVTRSKDNLISGTTLTAGVAPPYGNGGES